MGTCQFIQNYIVITAAVLGLQKHTSSTEFTVKVKDKVFVIHPVAGDKCLLCFNSIDNGDNITEIHVSDELSTDSSCVKSLCDCITEVLSKL